jgi:hypothetical protein
MYSIALVPDPLSAPAWDRPVVSTAYILPGIARNEPRIAAIYREDQRHSTPETKVKVIVNLSSENALTLNGKCQLWG